VEYEYRLSKFEKYIIVASGEEQQQQQQDQELTTLDYIIEELKRNNNKTKIDPYDLLSGFVVYLQQDERIRNPNTIRHFILTARNFLEYHDIEISPRKFKLRIRLPKAVGRRKEAIGKEEIREINLSTCSVKIFNCTVDYLKSSSAISCKSQLAYTQLPFFLCRHCNTLLRLFVRFKKPNTFFSSLERLSILIMVQKAIIS